MGLHTEEWRLIRFANSLYQLWTAVVAKRSRECAKTTTIFRRRIENLLWWVWDRNQWSAPQSVRSCLLLCI